MSYSPLDTPESIPAVFAEAWNRRDPDKLASLFDEDADFVNVTGLWWRDREAIRKAHAYGLETIFSDSTLRVTRTEVKWLSDAIAVVHARVRLEGQSPPAEGAEQPQQRTTLFSFVVRRGPGGWSCASAQNTDVVPHMETHVRGADGVLRPVSYRRS